LKQGLIQEEQLDTIVGRSLGLRMETGMFDSPEQNPYAKIPLEMLGAEAHHDVAEQVASQGLVLLKNPLRHGSSALKVLPLMKGRKTAVIGPHSHAERQLLGSYFTMACPLPTKCPKKDRGCPHGSANYPCPNPLLHSFCMLDWSCVPSPRHKYGDRNSGLTEIYLHF
jgi:hypothetical protein